MAGCRDSCRSNAHVLRRCKGLLAESLRNHQLGKSAYSRRLEHHYGGRKLCIEWLDEDGASLGKAVYHLESVLEKGLEGKQNALFVAEDMPENWPFRCLLAMEPMPPRTARQTGGLLSHLHFQYASQRNLLVDTETQKLHNPMWYATVCDGDGALLEKCNIVRALHHLPVWDALPEL